MRLQWEFCAIDTQMALETLIGSQNKKRDKYDKYGKGTYGEERGLKGRSGMSKLGVESNLNV